MEILKSLSIEPLMLGQQIVITLIVFILAKLLLFKKLQAVLERREDQTTNLESKANENFEKFQEMSDTYRQKIDNAYREAKNKLKSSKSAVMEREDALTRKAESEATSFVESASKEGRDEFEKQTQKLSAEADTLAGTLVRKLVD